MSGLHELVAEHARREPDRVAVWRAAGVVTFGELDRRAEEVADRLAAAGAGGAVVGLALADPLRHLVAVLGVWKAGAAYVPLPVDDPLPRTLAALAETGARVVLADVDTVPAPALRLDRAAAPPPRRHPVAVGDRDLAYVLYTSGSTGTPKGVAIEHGGVVNLARGLADLFGDLTAARVFQFARPSFDAWVWELAMSLPAGGLLCLPDPDGPLTGAELTRWLRAGRATHLSAAPSLLSTLSPEELPDLRCVVAGGEVLPESLVRRWRGRVDFINAYGPTEATVCVTAGRCTGVGRPSIGVPLPGVAVHLLDAAGHPVPPGEVGELHVGGPGVGRGYLARPELTRRHFRPDPFAADPGARLYRTGDLARLTAGGTYEFAGRVDRQLKVRGFRVEPAEVEEALRAHPGVADAAVSAADQRLVAHVRPTGAPVPAGPLRSFLRSRLPEHLVPSVFTTVDALPLTPNGKLDRDALPAARPRPDLGHGYAPPRGDTERAVARMWADVLGVAEVGADDDFFALGGTSLDLARLRTEVEGRWSLRLPVADLLAAHTVRLLAARIDGRVPSETSGDGYAPSGTRAERRRSHLEALAREVRG
ncbi:non-ribosomal peptide synthetase [Saccharothrix obliqua]|uniref:non-ribosomal peptide synthetase n=1 Tax=Saccharothrix obliqua TaxID=2861747 RepID=UPI001C5F79C2|nr:non-ribosomal peptide synthetase [Saccharothrix obliqua]MBW4717834.1 non-ribosomal peptide synthetase [Saccharothrix obliqua]